MHLGLTGVFGLAIAWPFSPSSEHEPALGWTAGMSPKRVFLPEVVGLVKENATMRAASSPSMSISSSYKR